uniref:Tripartite motif containing 16 n=1 Tax=Oncorhynchus mykiss TaxID=8022 RepID=A0A8K9XFP8_ONCMY
MQNVPEEWREEQRAGGGGEVDAKPWEGREALFQINTVNSKQDMDRGKENGETGVKERRKENVEMMNEGGKGTDKESLMMELTRLVQKTVKESSWWERRGIDITILVLAFLLLPPAFLLLGSSQILVFVLGMVLMGVSHAVISIKGTHLASHGSLSESPAWAEFWAVFFIEVCGSFTARAGVTGHIKMHHAHTNVIGLGDSSTWKIPCLPRSVYLFIAPLAIPIITPLVALAHRPVYVLPDPPAQEDLPDDPRGSEPSPEPPAGLDLRTLPHQLSRGTPPVPLSLGQHVSQGKAHRVPVSKGEGASIPGRHIPLPSAALLSQVPGAHGVRPAHHRAGGGAMMEGGRREGDRERETERGKQREGDRERETERGKQREGDRERETERETERGRQKVGDRGRETERGRQREDDRERATERGRRREGDRERETETGRQREGEREGDRDRERETERGRQRAGDRERETERGRQREGDRERETERGRQREGDRERETERGRQREGDRERETERGRQREVRGQRWRMTC